MPDRLIHKILLTMRFTTAILLLSLMQVSAASLAQKISLSEKSTPLSRVFKKIKAQAGIDFFISEELLRQSQQVTIEVSNTELSEVLEKIFKDQPLDYQIEDKFVVVSKKQKNLVETLIGRFQQISVKGRILDENQQPMNGATITLKSSNRSVKTDRNGSFYFSNVMENEKLIISYIGYKTLELQTAADMGDVSLALSEAKLEEVVVNAGYYTVKNSERTGSISRITAKDIEKQPVTNVLATMQGRMAGVNITQRTGMPGGGYDIKIRGQNSLRMGGNDPLYIIDGVPYAAESLTDGFTSAVLAGRPSPLNSIAPEQIESIEILKDADATAIYGSRGANGVVLISTKKGRNGALEFSANLSRGTNQVTRFPELFNTQQYISARKEAFANDGLKEYPEYAYDVNGTWDQNRYTNWQKDFLGKATYFNNLTSSLTGGSETTRFLVSAGFNDQTSIFGGDFKYRKGNFRSSLDHSSLDGKFNLSLSAGFTSQDNTLPGNDYTLEVMMLPPNAPPLYTEDGQLNWENGTFNNPLRYLLGIYSAKISDLLSNLRIKYQITNDLEISSGMGYSLTGHLDNSTSPSTMYAPVTGIGPESSTIFINTASRNSWIVEPQLNWKKAFGKHRLDILGGSTFQVQNGNSLTQLGYGFTNNALINNLSSASTTSVVADEKREYRYQAFFGRLNYIMDDKYILNLTGRRDGSSRFGPGRQFANFWATGAAWIFSKEDFLKNNSLFSFGKLRASYGVTGNDQIGDYQFNDTFGSSGIRYNGIIGLQPTRLYNPDFSWETNKKLEIALETGFFNNRIQLTAGFYRNLSSDQLTGIQLPGTTGFPSVQANLDATVENTGTEITLQSRNIHTSNFSWTSSLNLTISKNKLLSFPNLEGSPYTYQYIIGEPLNITRLYNYQGINPKTGIYQFQDSNSDGIVNYLDMTEIHNFNAKYFGGLQNLIRYKKISLDFLLQFVNQQNISLGSLLGGGGDMNAHSILLLDHWQKEGDPARTQIYTAGFNEAAVVAASTYKASNATVADASFIRMKNISLAWEISPKIFSKVKCQLNIQAQNLFTITSFTGGDPEFQTIGYLPPLRIISAGINIVL